MNKKQLLKEIADKHLLSDKPITEDNIFTMMQEYADEHLRLLLSNNNFIQERVLQIIQQNYNKFSGTNEAELHASEEISDLFALAMKEKQSIIESVLQLCSNKDTGREGCTYGDTNYDSQSVVYGYNLALDNIHNKIQSAQKK